MELTFDQIICYEAIGNMVTTHEESMETAIPEYCPDMARIIDTVGQLKIRSKNISEERLTISGTVRVCVLYSSEESTGLRNLSLSVPFECTMDDKRFARCESVRVCGRLLLAEAKPINSRKLSLRVIPEFTVTGFAKVAQQLCSDLPEPSADMQVQKQQMNCQLLTQVIEKPFTFTDEVPLDKNLEPLEDLLLDQVSLHVSSAQAVGNKVVVKGEAELAVLYRSESQSLCWYEAKLPFSQIMEGTDLDESCTFEAETQLSESDVRVIRGDDGTELGVSLSLSLMVHVYRPCAQTYVSDLYSTRYPTQVHTQPIAFPAYLPSAAVREESTQRLEPGMSFACLTDCSCGSVSVAAEDSGSILRATVYYKVLYLDEEGSPMCMERSFEVSGKWNGSAGCDGVSACCREAALQQGSGQWELRTVVEFLVPQTAEKSVLAVKAAEMDTEAASDSTKRPSLILRRFRPDETLWDIAKQYQTTASAIREANNLEDKSPLPDDVMLMIPRVR